MATHEAEGIILRQYALGESDRIIVFFTREVGKLRAVAKGVKRLKSRLGPTLEPLNHVRLTYFAREASELHRLLDCELIHAYLAADPEPLPVYLYSYFAELIQEVSQENNANPTLFRLLVAVLDAGCVASGWEQLVRYFELWTLRLSGFLPDYDYCSSCGKCVKEIGFYADAASGASRCGTCARRNGIRIRPETLGLIAEIQNRSPREFLNCTMAEPEKRELESLTQSLLHLHLEKPLKSYRGLQQFGTGM